MPPGRRLELSLYFRSQPPHLSAYMQLAAVPASPQSLEFTFPSYSLCGYSEHPFFPLALWEFLYFSPLKLVFIRKPFLASNTYTASFLSFFYHIYDLRMSPVVFPPDATVATCQISPGITDGGGAVCIFSPESIFSTGYDSLWNYLSFFMLFLTFLYYLINKHHPVLCSKRELLEQGRCLGWCRVNHSFDMWVDVKQLILLGLGTSISSHNFVKV